MLDKFEDCNVAVHAINNKIFRGKVIYYISEVDSDDGKESIIIRDIQAGKLIEFHREDIKTIETIK